jgi:putative nucleotidyltransferase with HDIG domain
MSRLKSYQSKIMMMAVIPLLVLFVFINGIYYFTIDEIAVREKKHEISTTLDAYKDSLDVFFEEIQHDLAYVAQIDAVRRVESDPQLETEVEHFFKQFLAQHTEYVILAYGTVSGDYYYDETTSSVPENFDPHVRPWYQVGIALEPGQIGYTDIYRDSGSGAVLLSMVTPVTDFDDHVVGVIGFAIDIDRWIESNNAHVIGTKGYTFVTKGDRIVIHPDASLVDTVVAWEDVAAASRSNSEVVLNIDDNGEPLILESRVIEGLRVVLWAVGYDRELMDTFNTTFRNSLILLGILLVGIVVMISLMSGFISREIKDMAVVSQRVIGGDSKARMSLDTSPEMQDVAKTFNTMADQINRQTNELVTSIHKLNTSYRETVALLSNAIEARDPFTQGHSKRVANHCLMMGRALNLDRNILDDLEFAAMLHDVGKISLPLEILNKTEPLTADEALIFQKHPQVGYFILKEIDRLKRVAEIVLEHHEWVNGQGYPRGVSGDDLKLESKILAICESYDAQSQSRPYRTVPLTYDQAKASMMAQRGTRFDPDLLDLFFSLLDQGTKKDRS